MTTQTTANNILTSADYMNDSSNLFNKYYAQFITESTISFIKSNIGIEKLLSSKCEHLNDLYSMSRGGAGSWIWDSTPFNLTVAREANEVHERGMGSPSTHTCIGKVCARMLIKEHKENLKTA